MADLAELDKRVSRIEQWKNGNGVKGAAQLIEEHEHRLDAIDIEHAKEPYIVKELMREAVKKALADRSHSVEGYIRAFGPYFAAIASIVIAILAGG